MAVKDWSTTAASNTGILTGLNLDGAVMTVPQVDNAFREMAAQIASQLGKMGFKGADITSASPSLVNATGWYTDITGSTTITAFGTVDAGQLFMLRFTGALTLTHNASSLILPGSANITTAAGDVAFMMSLGSGNWRCIQYQRASGVPIGGLPTSSTDNAVARFNGTAGAVQNSGVIVDDSDNITGVAALTATSFSGSGASLTALNATNLASGTVASARVSGSYTGITGTGALNAGSITSGFGSINIGASTFTTTGAVSCGTAALSSTISVAGTATMANVNASGAVIAQGVVRSGDGSAGTPGHSFANDADTGLYLAADGQVAAIAAGQEIFRWKVTGGNALTVGTTGIIDPTLGTTGISLSADGLLVASRTSDVAARFKRSDTGTLVHFYRAITQVGTISVDASSTSYNTSSDARKKKNFRSFDSGAIVDALEFGQFEWIADDTIGYGVLAQNAQPIFPPAITVNDKGYHEADYSKYTPVAMRELKAVRRRLAALEAHSNQ